MSAIKDAAYNFVHHEYPGGAEAMALRLGKSAAQWNHELRAPRGNAAKLAVESLCEAMELGLQAGCPNALAPLHVMNARFGGRFEPFATSAASDAPCDDVLALTSRMVKEFSDVLTQVSARTADGVVSDNDEREIAREGDELIVALFRLRECLHARNQAGKPPESNVYHPLRAA